MVDVTVCPFEIETRTRHGDLVRADVYLPEHRSGPVPILLGASPYQKSLRRLPAHWVFPFIEYGPMQLYLDEGYAYVAMDVPGSGRSEGVWDFVSRREGEAIHDMIEHVAAQDWSTGDVGMIGMSYYCWSQWNAARTRPPSLKCLGAYDGATDMYRDWMYHGGMPVEMFLDSWLFGAVITQHVWEGHDIRGGGRSELVYDILSHPLDDEWQRHRSPFWELDQIDIPVLSIGVWGKSSLHLRGNFTGFEGVKGPRQLLITEPDSFAGAQAQYADADFHRRELLPWYDHHLKNTNNGVMDRPPVRVFVQGEGKIREAQEWPPEDVTVADFYLSGERSGVVKSLNDGSLLEDEPRGESDATSWNYPDPKWMAGVTMFDEKGMPDHVARVNTFTSRPFDRDREFTGQGVLTLHASSNQADMDVIVKLTLLSGKGEEIKPVKVSQGWLRASHRAEDPELTSDMRPFHAHQKIEPIKPGTAYALRIELIPMSFLVRKGERLRLEISNFDSMITDAPMTHFYGQKVGTDTYHHDAAHPSHISLHERPRVQSGENK